MKQEEQNKIRTEWLVIYRRSTGNLSGTSFQDAVSIAQSEEEPVAAARKLTETAFTRGSADNITCIVVKFHHEEADPRDAEVEMPTISRAEESQPSSKEEEPEKTQNS